MAKLIVMFMILIAIQFCLIIYMDQDPNQTSIWKFVMNLDNWSSSDVLLIFGGIAAFLLLAGIASGGTFRFVTDFIVLGPVITGLLSIGVVFTNLAGVVRRDLINRFFTSCIGAASCYPATLLTAISIGPFALYYAWCVLEWWRGKDM
jgi:hypothetical protein